jgi:hypothetical protein
MDLGFLQFCELFGVLVVLWLYGFSSSIIAARLSQRGNKKV